MQATRPLLYKGFIGRSVDEFKRLSHIVFSLEGIKGAKAPYELHSFRSPSSIQDCKVMSDVEIGGVSNANLDWVPSPPPSSGVRPPSPHSPGYARFHGTISTQLPKDRPEIKRTGYAAFRTRDRPPTIFGRSLWNIDPYVYLALRVKSDGRSYFVNVQTESVVPTDLHQHRLFVKKPGEWETVLIKWNDFVRTNHGFVVEPQTEIMRQKVKSIGVGLTDRIPGPFELCIERMWATNDESEADSVLDVSTAREGELMTKQGQKIAWGSK
ncbi:complex I intermediate-associated protein 30-domain-containing protein [Achaetomium macrosporum]|uniref:Complex I intermediate-associated protein 30-domain-containing protein n=1 Tax=Achaetomium macrosporum TaxID=79813 RepID=A0AAN7CJN4_9PEZI|nr:complex I intermediate-associated protein 30-domain-containing protein [Achaetomium macrosporum]